MLKLETCARDIFNGIANKHLVGACYRKTRFLSRRSVDAYSTILDKELGAAACWDHPLLYKILVESHGVLGGVMFLEVGINLNSCKLGYRNCYYEAYNDADQSQEVDQSDNYAESEQLQE